MLIILRFAVCCGADHTQHHLIDNHIMFSCRYLLFPDVLRTTKSFKMATNLMQWNGNFIILLKFSSLPQLEFVILTTSSFWQLPVQPMMTIESKWQYFRFRVWFGNTIQPFYRGWKTLTKIKTLFCAETTSYKRASWEVVCLHDDVIKWKHFLRNWPFVRGIYRSPVNSPHKGQWRGALMFSLICVWINGWVNNREAGDLRRYCAHYDVTVMRAILQYSPITIHTMRRIQDNRSNCVISNTLTAIQIDGNKGDNGTWNDKRIWWRHQMEIFSALMVLCAGNSPVTGEYPHKGQWRGASMFSLICALNKRLSKQPWGWWFATPSRPLYTEDI